MVYGLFVFKVWFLYMKISVCCVSEWCKDDEDLVDLFSEIVVYKVV